MLPTVISQTEEDVNEQAEMLGLTREEFDTLASRWHRECPRIDEGYVALYCPELFFEAREYNRLRATARCQADIERLITIKEGIAARVEGST